MKDAQLLIDSQRLKQLRRENGLSQEALAEACEKKHLRVSIATIKRAETNKPVSYRTLNNIAQFFNVTTKELAISSPVESVVQSNARTAVQLSDQSEGAMGESSRILCTIQVIDQSNVVEEFKMTQPLLREFGDMDLAKLLIAEQSEQSFAVNHTQASLLFLLYKSLGQLRSA